MTRFLWAFAFWAFSSLGMIAAGQQFPKEFLRDDLANEKFVSYLTAALANLETWERGDFLVKEEFFFDSVKKGEEITGALVKESALIRLIFDHSENRYAVYKVATVETICFDDGGGDEPQKKTFLYAVNFDGKTRRLHHLSDREQYSITMDANQVAAIRDSGMFPDYRTAWLKGFLFEGYDFARLDSTLEPFKLGKFLHRAGFIRESVFLSYRNEIANDWEGWPKEKFICFDFEFSKDSHLPIKYVEKIVAGPRESLTQEVRSTWQLNNGIYVPKSIVMSRPMLLEVGQRTQAAPAEKSLQFHIFSINGDEFPENLFNGEKIKNLESIYAMVDPVANKASALLPTEPNRHTQDQ
jgi:hypothetical protein